MNIFLKSGILNIRKMLSSTMQIANPNFKKVREFQFAMHFIKVPRKLGVSWYIKKIIIKWPLFVPTNSKSLETSKKVYKKRKKKS